MKSIRNCYRVSHLVDREIAKMRWVALHTNSKDKKNDDGLCLSSKKNIHKLLVR